MAVTPYLKLQKPPFDSIPWDQAINGNMDILDSTIAQFLSVPGYSGTWANATNYITGQVLLDVTSATMWQCLVSHTSATTPTTFAQDRTAHPTYWSNTTTAPVVPVDQHNVGRNLLHNPLFNVAQRGAGPFTTGNPFTLDRWQLLTSTDTASVSQAAFSDAQRTSIGDEEAKYALSNVFTGNAAAGAFNLIIQRIENVRRLAGKTAIVSFWAAAASGTPKLGLSINQLFGTGGSPSADVAGIGQSVTLSTTLTRYSLTFAIPSVSGKTFGTSNNDSTQLAIWFSSGATNAAFAGNIGVQSGTIILWGAQLEIGSVATPLEKIDPRMDLANCQRFYQVGQMIHQSYNATGGGVYFTLALPVTMRALPSVVFTNTVSGNLSGLGAGAYTGTNVYFTGATVATGPTSLAGTYTASADL